MNQSLEKIKEILESGRLKDLIGFKEDIYFEAKGKSGYDFESPVGRYELAKDVSAFANAEGGYLIIGLKTDPMVKEKTDNVIELELIANEESEKKRYDGIIREYIYPSINPEINWIEDIDHPGFGILCIFIPKQNQNKKYFLITNIIGKNDRKREIVFGIVQRRDSSNHPLTKKKLYKMMQNGISDDAQKFSDIEGKIDSCNQKLSNIEGKIDSWKDVIPSREESPGDALNRRLSEIASEED